MHWNPATCRIHVIVVHIRKLEPREQSSCWHDSHFVLQGNWNWRWGVNQASWLYSRPNKYRKYCPGNSLSVCVVGFPVHSCFPVKEHNTKTTYMNRAHAVSLHRGMWWWLYTGSMLCYLEVYSSCSRSYALTNCWHNCKKSGSTMILLTCEVKVLFLVENCFYIHQMMHPEARDVHSSDLRRMCSCTAGVIRLRSICIFVTGACHHIMSSGKVVWAWNIYFCFQPCNVTPKDKQQNF